mmetsp:Transcript_13854/g.25949  ORF Transcript_13854/g.25949 Transcript_13854/m.25949 type:complete len:472 (-) Transcript_13854:226-1641(-)
MYSVRGPFLLLAAVAHAAQLPRLHPAATSTLGEGTWWAKVGDHIVHTPNADSGLSSNVGDYYYAYGSHRALTEELHEKRVGGAGRLHIFHLPEGKDSLDTQLPKVGGRRDAVSALVQLSHKDVLADARLFPNFEVPQGYTSGLSAAGEKVEKQVVDLITEDAAMNQLKELVSLGDGSTQTRSYSNTVASANSVSFLQKKFKDMGYAVCKQEFGEQTSVIASLQGSNPGAGSVTIGGHYDSRPFEGLAPGAVDNGSGASAVLTIAKALADAKVRPKKTIFFVSFAAEEPGLLGSEEYATRLTESAAASSFAQAQANASRQLFTRLCGGATDSALLEENAHIKTGGRSKARHEALVMDEIAWRSTNIKESTGPVVNLESYDWAQDVLKHLAGASKTHNGDSLKVTHSNNPFGSDHMSFLQKGVQSVLSIHGDDEGYPHYHQSEDALDQVNPSLYAMITKMNAGALLRLAGVDA